ncbi:sensor histidine kinase [Longispora albida]|uniref:sensor histidine kinase n=1 Tax=Longispora albida TaxID=203523 RepID=UPI000A2EEE62|nr:histidine kinase [Longispora albida]
MGSQDRHVSPVVAADAAEQEPRVMLGSRRWGVVVAIFFALFLVPDALEVTRRDLPAWLKVLSIAGLLVYAVSYVVLSVGVWHSPLRYRLAALAWLTVLASVLVATEGLGGLTLYIYVVAVAALTLPTRLMLLFNGGLLGTLLLVVLVWGETRSHFGSWLALLAIAATTGMMGMLLRNGRELVRTRHELANLAVVTERERVARDLHDVLGHSLTTITVKAGLARRLLETSGQAGSAAVDQAIGEISDLERLSRLALTEVRATVSGYRRASLAAEIAGARAALAAGQILADLPHAVDDVREELHEPFAYLVREGVTNVLRHSGASRCQIRLGADWLEITDNGAAPPGSPGLPGNGLTGLRERLAQAGAALEAGAMPGGGYRLRGQATVNGD